MKSINEMSLAEAQQAFADTVGRDHPLAVDPQLNLHPRALAPEAAPTEPSFFTDEGQIARYGAPIRQLVAEEKARAEAARQQEEQRLQSEWEERSRLADERERLDTRWEQV